MNILDVPAFYHDSAAALVEDRHIVTIRLSESDEARKSAFDVARDRPGLSV